MTWHAVPKDGRVSYCEECGAPMAWVNGDSGRIPIDLRWPRGSTGMWRAEEHAPKCTNRERWERQPNEDLDSRSSESVATADPFGEENEGGDSVLF